MKQLLVATAMLGVAGCMSAPKPPQTQALPQAPVEKPCAAKLSRPARKIFDAVQSGPQEGTLHERISNQTIELVMGGGLSRSQARPAAEEAADCLRAPS